MANAKARSGASTRDQALDELYGASPGAFTAKRDALAKALKAAGDIEGASGLEALRKPTQIAYVLNQLARRHAADLADLVDVGRELARAQRKALRGEAGSDLRDAIARQRAREGEGKAERAREGAAEAKRVAREAEVARGHAERAATAAARAARAATTSRSDAARAAKHARSIASRV
jgi:hypothetical protein